DGSDRLPCRGERQCSPDPRERHRPDRRAIAATSDHPGCRPSRGLGRAYQRHGGTASDCGRVSAHRQCRRVDHMTTTFVALVVTDLVASTALRVAIGEDAYDDLRADHDRLVSNCVTRSHGTVAKHTGDGVMATFTAASDALLAAERIQQAIERRNRDATHPLA